MYYKYSKHQKLILMETLTATEVATPILTKMIEKVGEEMGEKLPGTGEQGFGTYGKT